MSQSTIDDAMAGGLPAEATSATAAQAPTPAMLRKVALASCIGSTVE